MIADHPSIPNEAIPKTSIVTDSTIIDSKSSPAASHGREMADNERTNEERTAALLRAIQLLTLIASDDSSSLVSAQQELDEIQNSWKLQDSYVPQLRNSIERLQSTCRLLQQDSDSHSEQMHTLQHELYDNSIRIHKLERAVHKLHKKNERLSQKAEQHKKSLVKQVKSYVSKKNEDEQRHQLFAHERLLKLENHHASSRSRCSSRDTDFSDADLVALQVMGGVCDDEEELSVASSSASTVTDDGVATVRYSPRIQEEALSTTTKAPEYELTFPRGTRIGLQFHKVMMEKQQSTTPRGLLNDAILETGASHADGVPTTPSKDGSSSFSVHFNFDSLRGKHHEHQESNDFCYLVCGHYGFDEHDDEMAIHHRPKLGARLVKVNGESVEDMTLDKIKAAIKCTKREFFSLTFCNEQLTFKQREMLDKAVVATKEQYEQRSSESSNDSSSVEKGKDKPVIICMHEEGKASRLSSLFLQPTRSRTLSDTAIHVPTSKEKDVTVSPSTKGFYSILHGNSFGTKVESDAVDESNVSKQSLPEETGAIETPTKGRLSSMFNNVRSRTFSDNAVLLESESKDEGSEEKVPSKDVAPIPSGRGLYSILHCDASTTSNTLATNLSSDREELLESETPSKGNPISSLFNSAAPSKPFNSAVRDDLPTSDREPEGEEAPVDMPVENEPTKHFSSFLHRSSGQGRTDPDPEVSVEGESATPTKARVETASPLASSGTPPSLKLKKGMQSFGNKFKKWNS